MRILFVLAVALVLLVPARAPAAAPTGWSPPVLLEPTPTGFRVFRLDSGQGAVVAANARGDVAVAWVRERLSGPAPGCCEDQRVVVAYKPAGGAFGPPETVSPLGDDATDPSIAIDAAGDATVAWTVNEFLADLRFDQGGIGTAFRPAGASFEPPGYITRAPGGQPVVAASVDGEVLVAWEQLVRIRPRGGGGLYPLKIAASMRSPGGEFSKPVAVSGVNGPASLRATANQRPEMQLVALGEAAGTRLAWVRSHGGSSRCCSFVETAWRPAGGAFGTPVKLSQPVPGEEIGGPALTEEPGGTLVYWHEPGPGP